MDVKFFIIRLLLLLRFWISFVIVSLYLHGQPKLIALLFLDRLAENEIQIHYAGDPEGLLICGRLSTQKKMIAKLLVLSNGVSFL